MILVNHRRRTVVTERSKFTVADDSAGNRNALDISDVEIVCGCGIVVTFTDGTIASYPPEELAALRPHREPVNAKLTIIGPLN